MDRDGMKKMKKVILYPLSAIGHMNPMFHVAEALNSKGISITFILTKYNSPNPSSFSTDYSFHFIDDGIAAMETPPSNPVAFLAALNSNSRQPFRDCLESILGSEKGEKSVACLITDPLWVFTRAISEEFGLPRIMLHTSTAADLVILSSPDVLQHDDYPVFPEIIAMVEEVKASSGLICNSYEELEGPSLNTLRQNINIPVFPIGPLHKYSKTSATSSFLLKDKTPIIKWLDNQPPKSVLYVSFGSIATINKAEFEEIACGLANSNQPFLWVIRPDLVHGSENSQLLLEDFEEKVGERGRIVTWAPQQEVLTHTAVGGAFIHGGWNSAMESISEGVPVICMPCLFPDQKTIARHVTDVWRVGLRVDRGGIERGQVEEVIKRLMGDQEIRERLDEFKGTADKCVSHGGSSYESLEKLCSFILSL
ncbi:UDP-glycosyltransferase 76B1-like [Silene latifolia]|uniref:UDP-glycosyltransferase 76B1-like n=1 Tax=Silene latifolia TaxID=37657 RepID=UPI003D76BD57